MLLVCTSSEKIRGCFLIALFVFTAILVLMETSMLRINIVTVPLHDTAFGANRQLMSPKAEVSYNIHTEPFGSSSPAGKRDVSRTIYERFGYSKPVLSIVKGRTVYYKTFMVY